MKIDQEIKRADMVAWVAGETAKTVTLTAMDRAYLGALTALMSANPWLSNEPDEAVTVRELDNALVSMNSFVDIDALNSQITTLNAQIAALQAIDYQLAASDELVKTAFTFRVFKANYYNATAKVTSGAVTRAISNYRTATGTGTVGTEGLTLTTSNRLFLSALTIDTQNVDFHAWVKVDVSNSNTIDLWGIFGVSSYIRIQLNSVSSSGRMSIFESTGGNSTAAIAALAPNTWFYLQVTRIGTDVRVYVNGGLHISRIVASFSVIQSYIGYCGFNMGTKIYNSAELIIGGAAAQITALPTRE
jgi:hypothetical protein